MRLILAVSRHEMTLTERVCCANPVVAEVPSERCCSNVMRDLPSDMHKRDPA